MPVSTAIHLDVPVSDTRDAVVAVVTGLRGELVGGEHATDPAVPVELTMDTGMRAATPITATVEPSPDGTGTELRISAAPAERIPYFHWAVAWLERLTTRRHVRHLAQSIEARVLGKPAPPPPRRHTLAPPVAFDEREAHSLAVICAASAVVGFGSTLFSTNIDFIGTAYDASNRSLGIVGAVTRVGLLVSLVATALADRHGRRRLLLVSVAGVCAASAVSAAAPNLTVLGGAQLVSRGFFNTAFAVGAVAAVEEAPEGARAFSLAVLTLAIGFGQAFAVVLLPVGDLGTEAWRFSFAASAAAVLLLPSLARHLPETFRYRELAARATDLGRPRELLSPRYRRRFLLLVAAALLTQVLAAPSSQFTNRFLGDERGFSGFDIALFRGVTSAIPPILGLFLGGRLAESIGRKRLAIPGKVLATAFTVWFFLSDGLGLWFVGTVEIFLVSLIAPALAAFGPELFPTEVRGTANAFLLVAGVTGSAIGLVGVGALSDSMSLGTAMAWAGLAPIVSALVVLPRLPEASHHDLDVVSPPEV